VRCRRVHTSLIALTTVTLLGACSHDPDTPPGIDGPAVVDTSVVVTSPDTTNPDMTSPDTPTTDGLIDSIDGPVVVGSSVP
jgi:hypothetical protein